MCDRLDLFYQLGMQYTTSYHRHMQNNHLHTAYKLTIQQLQQMFQTDKQYILKHQMLVLTLRYKENTLQMLLR
jgi:hypothetical protein